VITFSVNELQTAVEQLETLLDIGQSKGLARIVGKRWLEANAFVLAKD
jgi:hypothetical protein